MRTHLNYLVLFKLLNKANLIYKLGGSIRNAWWNSFLEATTAGLPITNKHYRKVPEA
jgi:hypothetical protein